MSYMTLFKGDSSDIVPVRPQIEDPAGIISGDWVCKTALLDENKNPIISRVEATMSDDDLVWLVAISKEDTEAVPITGRFTRCWWVIQVENTSLAPAYSREQHFEIIIEKSGIS